MNRVLVIDDEAIVGRVIARALGAEFATDVFTCAEEGLRAAQGQPYDLGFLDVKLSNYDGFDLFEQLKGHQPDLKIVLMTGYLNPALEQRARRLEAFDFLQKPFHIEQIRTIAGRLREETGL